MGDIQTLLADPEFATLSPAGQRALAGRLDPELGSLSDAAFKTFLDKVSHPVTPGMEKLGGVPPGPVPIESQSAPAARMKYTPGWDDPLIRKDDKGEVIPPESRAWTAAKMAGQFLAAPVTGLLHTPWTIADWVKHGGHNPPSGGFLSEEPISMAYGNAIGAVTPEGAPGARVPVPATRL
jgi:hypothetical protein